MKKKLLKLAIKNLWLNRARGFHESFRFYDVGFNFFLHRLHVGDDQFFH